MLKSSLITALVIFLLFISASSYAFSARGHELVAAVAYQNLTDPARYELNKILSHEKRARDRSPERAASWADRIRRDEAYDYFKPLHFTNLPIGATGYDKERDCADSECLTEAVGRYLLLVADKSEDSLKRLEAMKLLIHFVGDIHQPLHIGTKKNRGGNLINVKYGRRITTLHELWDKYLVDDSYKSSDIKLRSRLLNKEIKEDERAEWSSNPNPDVWTGETWQLALHKAYMIDGHDYSARKNTLPIRLSKEYIKEGRRVTKRQIKKAGVRLAELLNRALDPAYPSR